MEILIVGAGIAGLMSGYLLSEKGYKVTILEAQDYTGGRICTVQPDGFDSFIETGAEFIHGKLPVTLKLLDEAGICYTRNEGEFWNAGDGKLKQGFSGNNSWTELEKALKKVKNDITMDEFLDTYFPAAEQLEMHRFIKSYAQSYDAGDTSRMSTLAFRDEMLNDDDAHQYRVDGGYKKLVDYLAEKCRKTGCTIHTSTVVKELVWSKDKVTATTDKVVPYSADKIIITIPVGVLQKKEGTGTIRFNPAIPNKLKEIETIGYGNAIKVFLQFKDAFWKKETFVKRYGKKIAKLGFILSNSTIPVWWTQYPKPSAMLTGWLGGPATGKFEPGKEAQIADGAIESVAHIFSMSNQEVQQELKAWKISDWAKNSFECGAYTYATVAAAKLGDALMQPVEDTLYFAGEGFYTGPNIGTVEAALVSGQQVAEMITK